MQTYHLRLESEVSKTFRCTRAANSLDIDPYKKNVHELNIQADIDSEFSIGLIIGASGSGKTTLAKSIYGQDCFKTILESELPILEQLPKELSYDECADILSGIGLTSVPCWIRPVKTLSNGQRARAEAALLMTNETGITVIDEWTSVVDRTVAKVMSHCVQKLARKKHKKIVLLSCHYDVIEWLNPDWIIDCNEQKFIDRRLLSPDERKRNEQLIFTIREIDQTSWKYFSKYHYLTDSLPHGKMENFGLFQNNTQIGYLNFCNYVPWRKSQRNKKMIMHWNRLVIHPDYCGLGLGIEFVNGCSKLLCNKYDIRSKFSSQSMYKSCTKSPHWRLADSDMKIGNIKELMRESFGRTKYASTIRTNVRTFSFKYVPSDSSNKI